MNKKQKKLLIECVDHLLEWELHMGRATTTKLVKGHFGLDVPETKVPMTSVVITNKTLIILMLF